eukprot:gb/GECH01007144.1/.p1 GENE.gb/GECH01007144.1/~~gb/GECH01007144.1/.p1  ORF type:complete len:480 (+),score=76.61 gb/GECH01007144.1/:1-1440(+)
MIQTQNTTNHMLKNNNQNQKSKSTAKKETGLTSRNVPPHLHFSHYPVAFQSHKLSSYYSTNGDVEVLDQYIVSNGKGYGEVIQRELDIFTAIGLRIAAKQWTAPHPKKKVFALHGFMDNAASYDGIGPILASENMDVIAIDLIGMGRSGHPPNYQSLSPDESVTAILDVLNTLGWQQSIVIGHSVGGSLAMKFAATFPERVEGWVSIDMLGPPTSEDSSNQVLRLAAISRVKMAGKERKRAKEIKARESNPSNKTSNDPHITNDGCISNNGSNLNYDSAHEKSVAASTRTKQKHVFSSVQELAKYIKSRYPYGLTFKAAMALASRHAKPAEFNGRDYRSSLKQRRSQSSPKLSGKVTMGASPAMTLAPTSWYWEENVISCLQQIQCPTLVLFGAHGWPVDPQTITQREKAIAPHLRTVKQLPFGNHIPHLENPEQVASVILQWMKQENIKDSNHQETNVTHSYTCAGFNSDHLLILSRL